MKTKPCECEHAAHFDSAARTPFGNSSHQYGHLFAERALVVVQTELGRFAVCPDCSMDCHDKNSLADLEEDDREPPEPDGECFRGDEAAAFEAEQQAKIQRELK